MELALQVLVRPLLMLALLFMAFVGAALVRPYIPDGRVKSLLYKKFRLVGPAENATVMWIARGLFVLIVVLIVFKPLSFLAR